MRIAAEPFDSADGAELRAEVEAEHVARYGADTEPGEKPTAEDVAVFLVARDDAGVAIGCGALRRVDDTRVELKRMYVRPSARGSGIGRRLLGALEAEARALGAHFAVLETGTLQVEAIGLYESVGYRPVPCEDASAGPESRCYERAL